MAVPKGLGSLALFSLTVLALLLVDSSDSVEHFCGGFMTFDFSSRSQYKARMTAITGWVLGLGPCGPNCSENDETQPTHGRRLQVIAQRNQNDFFGNWTMETAGVGMVSGNHTDITDYVNNNIRGRVSSVNELLQWEQEIAELEIDIDPLPEFTDIFVSGHSWKAFSVNTHVPDPIYVLQTKIRPQIRDDTDRPNNSPVALYRPVYRIKINNVTQISIATSDPDGDLVKCRAAGFVEIDGISPLGSTTIREDCVVEINASEQANFTDGSWGVVALVVEEFNRFPIKLGTRNIPAYDIHGLSSTILTFMIQAKINLTLPEFVEPTPLSQHVYTVHAGSVLTIPLYARPGHGSPPGTSIIGYDMLSLPDHNMTVPAPVPSSGETYFSQINWRTEDKDTGNFIIQVVAIDSDSYESMDRSYVIEVKDVIFTQESATNENPYFPFFPTLGSFTCPQGSTCSFPIYAAPGDERNTIVDIHLLVGNTTIPGINMSSPQQVLYRGQQVYRSDVQLTSELWGNHSVCFVARDNTDLETEKCLEVDLIPPNPCDHQPCGSNAITCIPHGVTYECICKENFEGVDCSILIDPCLTKNCKNNATCLSNGQIAACKCPTGFSGDQCGTNLDDCHSNSCLNNGVCVDELQGFHCNCQPGYQGINCDSVPSQCRNQCSNGGVCIVENAVAVCQCPLTASGDTCTSANLDIPINRNTDTSQPHFVVPTPRNGLQINCTVGETCTLPLFIKGPLNPLPGLQTGLVSQGIIADISVPVVDEISGLSNTLTSSLSVTPLEIGSHHVCVELVDANRNNVDNICYEIQSQISSGPEEKPYIGQQGAAFSDLTMPDESDIVCLRGQPCHIIVQTDANIYTRSCVPVQSLSQGVFAFEVAGTTNTTCATDILLDTENPTDRICLRAGIGGEERCYTVHNIQNDPCDPNPCAHNGLCVNSPSLSTGYSCVCHVPFEGPNCSIAGRCNEDVCLNNGVCVNGDVGFQCLCQPGYTEDNCREVPDQCANQGGCDEEAMCIVRNNQTVCLCPLGKDGGNCQQTNTDLAVNEDVHVDAPHFIEPTPISGTEVVCQIGMPCIIPLYIRSYPDTPCRLIQGWMSEDIHLEFSPLQPDGVTGLPNTLKSSMCVTPTFEGVNQVCAELKDLSSDNVDTVCYTINAKDIVDPTLAVSVEGRFAPSAPLNASQLNCRVDQACHIISETLKTSNGECVPVQPCSLGAHAFQTKSVDANTCGTDILISSDTSTPPGSICLQAGLNGEMRTYDVHFDTGSDSCTSNPCQNNGRCVVSSSSSDGYFCACTVPYKGPTCSQVANCQENSCQNNALCVDTTNGTGFYCDCQPGYTGDNCRYVPEGCVNKNCQGDAFCVVVNNAAICECPLGKAGSVCQIPNVIVPLNSSTTSNNSQVIIPTPLSGTQIFCTLGATCNIPIYMTQQTNGVPLVSRGSSSPEVITSYSVPKPDNTTGLPNTLETTAYITPTEEGEYYVCTDINNGQENICYTITVGNAPSTTTTPNEYKENGQFTDNTLPDGSRITCRANQPCHMIVQSATNSTDNCVQVQPSGSIGVQTFTTNRIDQNTCVTDVLIDPQIITDNVCVQIGVSGEERCYGVDVINNTNDACSSHTCQNGGLCINQLQKNPDFNCSCPVPFEGPDCTIRGTCADGRCMANSLCVDQENNSGFQCHCLHGYSGDDCRNVPMECVEKGCAEGSICISNETDTLCICPLGMGGDLCDMHTFIPVNNILNSTSQPYAIAPTLQPGAQIICVVGSPCDIPVYVNNNGPGMNPVVTTGPTSPELQTLVSDPRPDNTSVTDAMKSTVTVIPTEPGTHHVCIDITDAVNPGEDSVCYLIVSQPPPDASTQPNLNKEDGVFTNKTLQNGSTIICHTGQPCYVTTQTVIDSSGKCIPVRLQSPGALIFASSPVDEDTCTANILIDPDQVMGNNVCWQVGTSGEERCYIVNELNDTNNPCTDLSCINNGQCIPSESEPLHFLCACPVPFSGPICEQVDECSDHRCEHDSICVDENIGYQCQCLPGYQGDGCSDMPNECLAKNCPEEAICVVIGEVAVCKCPLNSDDPQCNASSQAEPVNNINTQTKPFFVIPTPPAGLQISCYVKSPCYVAVYVTGTHGSNAPKLTVGANPQNMNIFIPEMILTNVTGHPEIYTSTISITPEMTGEQSMCVDVRATDNSSISDSICYRILSQLPPETTQMPPAGGSLDGRFAVSSLPNGSEIVCLADQECHVIIQTEKNASDMCVQVRPQSRGVFAFDTSTDTGNACATNILIEPTDVQNGVVCLEIGFQGEERCYQVTELNSTNDACESNPCSNNGQCIPSPSDSLHYTCACPVPYTGSTCEEVGHCSDERCSNGAVCIDTNATHGFKCNCLPGYSGDGCTSVPEECFRTQCPGGAICVVTEGVAECKCPLNSQGPLCHALQQGGSVNKNKSQSETFFIIPTPPHGLQIICDVGSTCQLPVYVNSTNLSPVLKAGSATPGINLFIPVISANNVTGLTGTFTSTLVIRPTQPGEYYFCVDVHSTENSPSSDTICYRVLSQEPRETTQQPPTTWSTQGQFSGSSLPNGSEIICVAEQQCHLIVETEKNANDDCVQVRAQSLGVYAFTTSAINEEMCGTNILIDPKTVQDGLVCLEVGFEGEQRCYQVPNNEYDPCQNVSCSNNGTCIPSPLKNPNNLCACRVPFTGPTCSDAGHCNVERCSNDAVCTETGGTGGFQCQCVPGYTGDICSAVPGECLTKGCPEEAICVVDGGNVECKCPLNSADPECQALREGEPVNKNKVQSKPYFAIPTPPHGLQISCYVGSPCQLPVYVKNTPNCPDVPVVKAGPATDVNINIPSLSTDSVTGLPDFYTTTLSITPTQTGEHYVCLDLYATDSSPRSDSVCYRVHIEEPSGKILSTTQPPPATWQTEGRFLGSSLPNGSEIVCVTDKQCHVVLQTEKNATGDCVQLRAQSPGAYVFTTSASVFSTCVTNVLIDPKTVQNGEMCLGVGFQGEERCYHVTEVNNSNNPCENNICANNGRCIPAPSETPNYVCACPVPFKGPTCAEVGLCKDERCSNNAVCIDINAVDGFECLCLSGYSGETCTEVPETCVNITCPEGAMCVVLEGVAQCKCPINRQNPLCGTSIDANPINGNTALNEPYFVIPTPPSGLQIECYVNSPCPVTIYVKDSNAEVAKLAVGLNSPGVSTNISELILDTMTGQPQIFTSTVIITSTQAGQQHVCVDVFASGASNKSDTVCYRINSQQTPATTELPPTIGELGGQFSSSSLPNRSEILCVTGQQCHMIVHTVKNESHGCDPVRPQTLGVYVFSISDPNEDDCVTDILIDPANGTNRDMCLVVGYQGEERCYEVTQIDGSTHPCRTETCSSHGQCIPTGDGTFECACMVPYTGHTCDIKDSCTEDKCVNHGMCIGADTAAGFICQCLPGYEGNDCSTVPIECTNSGCQSPAICVMENQTPICKCPLGQQGQTCNTSMTGGAPVNTSVQTNKPYFSVPTPASGFQMVCHVNIQCNIPLYVAGSSNSQPFLKTELTSTVLSTDLSATTPDNVTGLRDVYTTTLSLTPTENGIHHVCVMLSETSNSAVTDSVCYIIVSQDAPVVTTQPHVGPLGSEFTINTPTNGSRIACTVHQECHMIIETEIKDGKCVPARPVSSGVYAFNTDNVTCSTDILIDPNATSNGQVCLEAGYNGDNRCYEVYTVNYQDHPCNSGPCLHEGHCIPTGNDSYTCACTFSFEEENCSIAAKCNTQTCLNNGICLDVSDSGLTCDCLSGYDGPDCRIAPDECQNQACDAKSICVLESGQPVCKCPLGSESASCTTVNETLPVNPILNKAEPYFIVPTPPSGLQISCSVGRACQVSLYIKGAEAVVTTGPTSRDVTTVLSGLKPDNSTGLPDVRLSSLSFTPTVPGEHYVCVEVKEHLDSPTADSVCYTIISQLPEVETTPQTPGPNGGLFAVGSLATGSQITCILGNPCHIISETAKAPNENCVGVRPKTQGAFAFQTVIVDNDTCATQILIDPSSVNNSRVCLEVGFDGEERCYNLATVNTTTHPCYNYLSNHPCGTGECIPSTTQGSQYVCACRVPNTGTGCSEVGSCSDQMCVNNAVCTQKYPPDDGFECQCLPGYNGDDCHSEPVECVDKKCPAGSICVVQSGSAVCKCPLGSLDTACSPGNQIILTTPTPDSSKPTISVPTPPTGLEISCSVGSTCQIPFYVTGTQTPLPLTVTGPTSPGIATSFSPLVPDTLTGLPNTLTSTLSVTPNEAGEQYVCAEVQGHGAGASTDTVCYRIVSTLPEATIAPPPIVGPLGGNFANSSLPNGSRIICVKDEPCHLMIQTIKNESGLCVPVRSQTVGVYAFNTSESNGDTCGTDILIDHINGSFCLEVGYNGEERCYGAMEIDTTYDACQSSPCQNNGHCIPITNNDYECACPVPFTGSNCQDYGTCSDNRCVNDAICQDSGSTAGFVCQCQEGYTGKSCHDAPQVCLTKSCSPESLCTLNATEAICRCPLGLSGDTCSSESGSQPVNKDTNTSKPYFIIPTPPSGFQMVCHLNTECNIPLYIAGSPDSQPVVSMGLASTVLNMEFSAVRPDNVLGLRDIYTTTVSLTPTKNGTHYICLDLRETLSSDVSDNVCYTIVSQEVPVVTAQPHVGPMGSQFTTNTPTDGSRIACTVHQECHVIIETEIKGGKCFPARPVSSGVYTFNTDNVTCSTDMLIDPDTVSNGQVCLEAGYEGDRRCYEVYTVNEQDHPCSLDPCLHGGLCIPTGNTSYTCACTLSFVEENCSIAATCNTQTCLNHGICLEVSGSGLTCDCLSGYNGHDCRIAPDECQNKTCDAKSICILEAGQPVCKCPLGSASESCTTVNETLPVNEVSNLQEPHFVLPTPPSGLQILCSVGRTCTVPLYVKGVVAVVTTGPTSRDVTTVLSGLKPDNSTGLPDVRLSSLSFTPTVPGEHYVCVEVKENLDSTTRDSVCYTIISHSPEGAITTPIPGPNGGLFTDSSLPAGSKITCFLGNPCYIISESVKDPDENCVDVRPTTQGALAFQTVIVDNDTCATQILIDPPSVNNGRVCLEVGIDGEERCYNLTTVNTTTHPCYNPPSNHPCGTGECIPSTTQASQYVCACRVPNTGTGCSEVGSCSDQLCVNNAVCTQKSLPDNGFECQCLPGYNGDDCHIEPEECADKKCPDGAICVVQSGSAVCKCPLGSLDTTCSPGNQNISTASAPDSSKPTISAPTPPTGLEISCSIGSTCQIPFYITGTGSPLTVTGPTTPGVATSFSPLVPDMLTGLPNTLTSTISVTPKEAGTQHVCVEVQEQGISASTDTVCYRIVSTLPEATTAPPSPIGPLGGHFANSSLPNGSKVICVKDEPCHLMMQTAKNESGHCVPVRSQTVGVYAFNTSESNGDTCGTDILIDHINGSFCLEVGYNGEERCYGAVEIDTTYDACQSSPCQNNGHCIPITNNDYECACPVPFTGSNCQDNGSCSEQRCVNGAICLDSGSTGGFVCQCLEGYTGNSCHDAPQACLNTGCSPEALCMLNAGQVICRCPLGLGGETCTTESGATPVNENADTRKPFACAPTPVTGTQIVCILGSPCTIPLYIGGPTGSTPQITTGPTSSGVHTQFLPITSDNSTGLTDKFTTAVSVTPQAAGEEHVCLEIGEGRDSEGKDTVCYTIVVTDTPDPSAGLPSGSMFTENSLRNNSQIFCIEDQECHIIAETFKNESGDCIPLRPLSNGTYTFNTYATRGNSCGTDVLIDPDLLTDGRVCLNAGYSTDKRCYNVTTIDDNHPCRSRTNSCENNGLCIPNGTDTFYCACVVPFEGERCEYVKHCSPDSCVNGACSDTATGFVCICLPGYQGAQCRDASGECALKNCSTGVCIEENSKAVCLCPLGENCEIGSGPIPATTTTTTPSIAVFRDPTPRSGLQVSCIVGMECKIPLFITNPPGTQPTVTQGQTSPGVTTIIPVPKSDNSTGHSNGLTTTLVVTPKEVGEHYVCCDVRTTPDGNVTDSVCYTVKSDAPLASTPTPVVHQEFVQFDESFLPAGSQITCERNETCRIVCQTLKNSSGDCIPVRATTAGVYAFYTSPVSESSCSTDILIDPESVSNGQICLKVGYQGQERCYGVIVTDENTVQPCTTSPCQNGGVCIPLGNGGHKCACPARFSGTLCEQVINSCTNDRCGGHGRCEESDNGFSCLCFSGYSGDTCNSVPEECALKCPEGVLCVKEGGKAVCKCPTGRTGETCEEVTLGIPTNPNANPSVPHFVQPTLSNGAVINCCAGSTCLLSIKAADNTTAPVFTMGPTSPHLVAYITNVNTTAFVTSADLALTPEAVGSFQVCVEVRKPTENNRSQDVVCYTVTCIQTPVSTISSPTVGPQGGRFTDTSLPQESRIPCNSGQECLFQIHTSRNPSGECVPVRQHSDGVYLMTMNTITCTVDVSVDPSVNANRTVCLEAGVQGEVRCYTVQERNISNDLCTPSPCQNGGHCVPLSNSFSCACSVPYTGDTCTNISKCTEGSCAHHAVCIDLENNAGFHCVCPPGFSGVDCRDAPQPCAEKRCSSNSKCLINNVTGNAECICPLGFSGDTCDSTSSNLTSSSMEPQQCAVDPVDQSIICRLDSSCSISLFITSPGAIPVVRQDLTSPELVFNGNLSSSSLVRNMYKVSFNVTSSKPGEHRACIEISGSLGNQCHTLYCYTVTFVAPATDWPLLPGVTQGTILPDTSLPTNRTITCNTQTCHVILETAKPKDENCSNAQSQTAGVVVFWTESFDDETCTTDVLIVPSEIENNSACLKFGTPEPRCYPVRPPTLIDDPCLSNPCTNGGTCLRIRGDNPSFICDCRTDNAGERCEVTSQHCSMEKDTFKQAVVQRSVQCTCTNPETNRTTVVVRPRPSSDRLWQCGLTSAGSVIGVMALSLGVYLAVKKYKTVSGRQKSYGKMAQSNRRGS